MTKAKQISHKISLSFPQVEALSNLLQSVSHLKVETDDQFKLDNFRLIQSVASDLVIRLMNRPWRDAKEQKVNQTHFNISEIRTIIAAMHYVRIPKQFENDLKLLTELILELRALLGEMPIKKSDIILLDKPFIN